MNVPLLEFDRGTFRIHQSQSRGGTLAAPVLMFMNMKGGVGKTTLAVEISRTLAYDYDKDVLLIDYDPQANASLAFLGPSEYFSILDQGKSIAHCLLPQTKPDDPFEIVGASPPLAVDHTAYTVSVRHWVYEDNPTQKAGKLELIPGNLDLMRLALNPLSPRIDSFLLSRWNGLVDSAAELYDCVVVDCHPSGSFFTKSALLTSDAAIVPVTSDAYAATGLRMMRRHMEMWEPAGGAREFVVVFNDAHDSWDSTVESDIRNDKRFSTHCLPSRIPYSALLRNLASRHRTAAEQKVAHRHRMGDLVSKATSEMVGYLQDRKIFDSSWREP